MDTSPSSLTNREKKKNTQIDKTTSFCHYCSSHCFTGSLLERKLYLKCSSTRIFLALLFLLDHSSPLSDHSYTTHYLFVKWSFTPPCAANVSILVALPSVISLCLCKCMLPTPENGEQLNILIFYQDGYFHIGYRGDWPLVHQYVETTSTV